MDLAFSDALVPDMDKIKTCMVFIAVWLVVYTCFPSFKTLWTMLKLLARASFATAVAVPVAAVVLDKTIREAAVEFVASAAKQRLILS